jgi:ABC-type amino acid transport system permease subunit
MKTSTIKIFLFLAILFIVTTTIFHLLSYFPSLRTSGSLMIFLTVISIFPTFAAAIKSIKKYTAKSDPRKIWQKVLRGTPVLLKRMTWFVVAYCFFNFFYSLFYLNGGLSPEKVDGKYLLQYQGKVVKEITEEEYYEHKAYVYRGFSGHAILFQFISIAMLSSAYRLEIHAAGFEKAE